MTTLLHPVATSAFGLLLLSLSSLANATTGPVDQFGCHTAEKVGYHCHPERAPVQEERLPGNETREQRNERLKRECKGLPNAGACTGFAS